MKPTNRFYVGGPLLDPPDDDIEPCQRCGGDGSVWHRMNSIFIDCSICNKEMEDPNDYPEEK
jgi:hypothetical protein